MAGDPLIENARIPYITRFGRRQSLGAATVI